MKQISFFTRGTMAALTKEEGGPLSCSASSHPTSVPRINPFHLSLCGNTTSEPPNKGGRKPLPCTGVRAGGWAAGGGQRAEARWCPSSRSPWAGGSCPCLLPISRSPSRTFSIKVLPASLAAGAGKEGAFFAPTPLLPPGHGVCSRIRPMELLHPRSPGGAGCLQQHRGPGCAAPGSL